MGYDAGLEAGNFGRMPPVRGGDVPQAGALLPHRAHALLADARPSDLASLDALNRRFWAWVEGEYHASPHRGLDGLTTERNRAALYRQIKNEVTRLGTEARTRPVLILDEAHGLRSDVLEEMRLLTNYAMDSQNRLCLLFCEQTELRRRLGMAVHEALNQRVVVRYHLPPLTRDEAGGAWAPRWLSSSPPPSKPSFKPPKACRARSTCSPITASSPLRSPRQGP